MFGLVDMYSANAAAAAGCLVWADTSHRPPPSAPVTWAPFVAAGGGYAAIVPVGTPVEVPVWNTAVPYHSGPTIMTTFLASKPDANTPVVVNDLPSTGASILAIVVQLGEEGSIWIVFAATT